MGELATYNRKRHFGVTAEPPGRKAKTKTGNLYLIQKHAATRLHYDFRLELDGVLLSWAVTKGPSLDPADKRLAVRTEDHPVAYGGFEGIIPRGEYGGGTVMLWDTGGWEPLGDARAMLEKGHLEFMLKGERLHGRWHLIRMQGKGEKRENWLLVKGDDEYARPGEGMSLVEETTTSAVSGRTLEEIAAAPDVWRSGVKKAAKELQKAVARTGRKEKLPDFIPPALATLVREAPSGRDWLHEIKYDGYRAQAHLSGERARVFTRSGLDWTAKFPAIAEACATLPAQAAILDGEIVVLGENGVTSFKRLKDAIGSGDDSAMLYYAFDLLHLDGKDLRGLPLTERKALLRTLLKDAPANIRYSDHIVGQGSEFHAQACQSGLEGIVSKKASAKYAAGQRAPDWKKVKCSKRQEFVVIGYEKSQRQRHGLRALLLGFYEDGRLVYTGKVGTGFTHDVADAIMAKLRKMEVKENPVPKAPRAEVRNAVWVRPELVAEIEYFERTSDGRLRHPSFQGLREDKKAHDVVLEVPAEREFPSPLEGEGRGGGSRRRSAAAATPLQPPPASGGRLSTSPPSARGGRLSTSPPPAGGGRSGGGHAAKKTARKPTKDTYGGVPLSSPDKILFPEQGLTKQDMAEYYEAVADWMVPHVLDRPISLVRCPMGRARKCFFQRHRHDGDAGHLADVAVPIKGRIEQYMYLPEKTGIFQMVQMGALELHLWGSRVDRPLQPDRLVIDLDPGPDVPFQKVIDAARETRARLADLGLESFVKTTGGKGLHVVFPIERRLTWDEAKPFTKALAQAMEADGPQSYVTNMRKDLRGGKIFIDYLRNDVTASAIAPYSTRSREGAPVAAPLFWEELDTLTGGDAYNTSNLPARLAALKSDPWAEMGSIRQSVTRVMMKTLGMKI